MPTPRRNDREVNLLDVPNLATRKSLLVSEAGSATIRGARDVRIHVYVDGSVSITVEGIQMMNIHRPGQLEVHAYHSPSLVQSIAQEKD